MSHWLLFRNATFAMSFRKIPKNKSQNQAVKRRVISTVPFGGRPLIWGYGVRDLAELFQTTEGAIRKLIQRGRLVPDNLKSIVYLYAEWFKDELETVQTLADLKKECECHPLAKGTCKACQVASLLNKEGVDVALTKNAEDNKPFLPKGGGEPWCLDCGAGTKPECSCEPKATCTCAAAAEDPHCKQHGHRIIWKNYVKPGFPVMTVCIVCHGGFTCAACNHWNDAETDCPCQNEKSSLVTSLTMCSKCGTDHKSCFCTETWHCTICLCKAEQVKNHKQWHAKGCTCDFCDIEVHGPDCKCDACCNAT